MKKYLIKYRDFNLETHCVTYSANSCDSALDKLFDEYGTVDEILEIYEEVMQ